ncbi:hypothetical protein ACFWPX_30185 [Nocardia sp. NPDC058518]|uniref:hypothetical protein n=1 Tax=Nocardia sp. NPDC058518 TaxID=3346534 RepID=UPI00365F3C52
MTQTLTTPTDPAHTTHIPNVGPIQITTRRDDHTAAVIYTLTGHRIHGSISIRVALPLKTPTATWAQFGFGIAADTPADQWSDRLTINGTRLVGNNYDTKIDTLHGITSEGAWRRIRRINTTTNSTEPAPTHTTTRTLTILAALITDFATRPDLPELHRLAAARTARHELDTISARIASLEGQAADTRTALRRTRQRAHILTQIASTQELPKPPVDLLPHL